MASYNNAQNKAAKAISGYFGGGSKESAPEVEDGDENSLSARITNALKRRKKKPAVESKDDFVQAETSAKINGVN